MSHLKVSIHKVVLSVTSASLKTFVFLRDDGSIGLQKPVFVTERICGKIFSVQSEFKKK